MENYKYHLEKYHGVGSRHECPQCHDKHSFAYYVDDNGNIIDKTVGRCNHEMLEYLQVSGGANW